ncbi:MAG: AAA family ATPase [Planctomycetota bacterium]
MEAVLFTGAPAAGKSTFYRERFFATHVRVSLDLLKTRNRERRLLDFCFETSQRFVVDNTNPTHESRAAYLSSAAEVGFRVIGYYFESKVGDCLKRNADRIGRVPDVAILSTAKRLEIPDKSEGFDELWYVRMVEPGFQVEEWRDEVR